MLHIYIYDISRLRVNLLEPSWPVQACNGIAFPLCIYTLHTSSPCILLLLVYAQRIQDYVILCCAFVIVTVRTIYTVAQAVTLLTFIRELQCSRLDAEFDNNA